MYFSFTSPTALSQLPIAKKYKQKRFSVTCFMSQHHYNSPNEGNIHPRNRINAHNLRQKETRVKMIMMMYRVHCRRCVVNLLKPLSQSRQARRVRLFSIYFISPQESGLDPTKRYCTL